MSEQARRITLIRHGQSATAWKKLLSGHRGCQGLSELGQAQAALLRDIVGNPFRPIAADPKWLTSAVVGIARTIYDGRDFSAMPVMADALEEAGCDYADVLAHCRGDGPHTRGCWVVDLLLGKG